MKRGFTLIELLIVVAIIAILAAIAVPNFLEAQTRSKVSRVYADMRSLATAIEEYATDWNRPPIGGLEGWKLYNEPAGNSEDDYAKLTTPIAYITTIPIDPFVVKGREGTWTKKVFDYQVFVSGDKVNNTFGICFSRGYTWNLQTVGPSRNDVNPYGGNAKIVNPHKVLSGEFPCHVYDSTNGTVSLGYIMRTNKGIYTGAEWEPAP